MKNLVVIPTYNERENIAELVKSIHAVNSDLHILVVDDNSPDGTGKLVQQLMQEDQLLHLLSRPGKAGLGKAYVAGFGWGLENGYDAFIEMDADFSHRPQDLIPLVGALKDNDFAIGSRWVKDGNTVNWSIFRKLVSLGGSFYSRLVLGYPIRDWTGGFNAYKRQVLEKIDLNNIRSEGYSFQIELKYRASKNGFKGQEVPIVFDERRGGVSKMSAKIVAEALYKVWSIRFN